MFDATFDDIWNKVRRPPLYPSNLRSLSFCSNYLKINFSGKFSHFLEMGDPQGHFPTLGDLLTAPGEKLQVIEKWGISVNILAVWQDRRLDSPVDDTDDTDT